MGDNRVLKAAGLAAAAGVATYAGLGERKRALIGRDLEYYRVIFRLLRTGQKWRANNLTVAQVLAERVEKQPDDVFVSSVEGQSWTFKDMDEWSNRASKVLLAKGLQRGDAVAVACGNRPEFGGIVLSVGKIGAAAALVNYNLKGQVREKERVTHVCVLDA